MIRVLSLLLFSIVLLSASVNSTVIRHPFNRKHHAFIPYDSPAFKVPLSKVELTDEQKAAFIDLVSNSQKEVHNRWHKNHVMLQKTATTTNSVHSMKLGNFRNSQWLGEISIGHEDNSFKMIFDTGSANIWINSNKCSDEGCKNHKQYESEKSKTYKELGLDLDVEFGTGELVGKINADDVYVAGVQVTQQKIAEVTKQIGSIFKECAFDGIVGLGFPSMAAYGMDPLFDSIMNQGRLDKNIFSFYFAKGHNTENSHIILGGADPDYFTPPLTYFPVIEKHYWTLRASNILVDGKDVGLCQGGCKVVADTGTTLFTAPSEELDILLDLINADSSCSNLNTLPTITFVLENGSTDPENNSKGTNIEYTLTAEEYMLNRGEFDSNSCTPGIMPLDVQAPHGPLWILGDLFLKKYYSVYDRDNDVVGFALAKHQN